MGTIYYVLVRVLLNASFRYPYGGVPSVDQAAWAGFSVGVPTGNDTFWKMGTIPKVKNRLPSV